MSESLQPGQDTPLIRQYLEIKNQCKDAILFFRLGDFYEMFFEDAVIASKVLDIALTSRDKSAKNPIPLCGVPHHSSKNYIAKLLDAGHKVAICEQVEDASLAKGIVKREIVKMITAGTRSDEEGLAPTETNTILSITLEKVGFALSWIEVSSGQIWTTVEQDLEKAVSFVLRLKPVEIVYPDAFGILELVKRLKDDSRIALTRFESIAAWLLEVAETEVPRRFQVSHLDSLGLEATPGVAKSIFALLYYIEEGNRLQIPHIQPPKKWLSDQFLYLDPTTVENLELIESKKGSLKASLFETLNETSTGLGARELKFRMLNPSRNLDLIQRRLDMVEMLVQRPDILSALRSSLKKLTDIERPMRRIAAKLATVQDLISLRSSLKVVPELKSIVQQMDSPLYAKVDADLILHHELCKQLEDTLGDHLDLSYGFVREGYDLELDRLRSLSSLGKEWLVSLEAQERQKTGIPSLKISYNRVFGYYIEVTKTHQDKVPAEYIRKQTLVSAERYVTPELKAKEREIESAKERIATLEAEILQKLRSDVALNVHSLQVLISGIAELDVQSSLAFLATQWNYTKPVVTDQFSLSVVQGRHPVVERKVVQERFVPNDIDLSSDSPFILLTGPNMAGKSTIMRQTALTVLMAQMGSFVPAQSAKIGIVDRIFTRIGASDDLSGGRSTFMVEMNETAQILSNATSHSLILLDEIGRGTSTYDGLSIAWAVAEDICKRIHAKTIFATHYHELTELAQTQAGIKNMRMAVQDWNGRLVFLRKIEEGIIGRSYGIEVAQIAGVRETVISRAKEILRSLENQKQKNLPEQQTVVATPKPQQESKWVDHIKSMPLDEITPRQALDILYDLKKNVLV